MTTSTSARALAAVTSHAAALGLDVEDALVLHDSNRLAVRLVPCDVLARVAPGDPANRDVAAFEVEVAQRFAAPDSVVGALESNVDPRVYECDGFAITYWMYFEPLGSAISSAEYAVALDRLHTELRHGDVEAPRFTARVDEARGIVCDAARSPELTDPDRALLADTLTRLGRSVAERSMHEQLIHGEPHPGNVVNAAVGVRFVDLQTCCHGPVEFDLAHAPDGVAERYQGLDPVQLRDCGHLVLAMIAAWRADRTDRLPDGRRMLDRLLDQLRRETT